MLSVRDPDVCWSSWTVLLKWEVREGGRATDALRKLRPAVAELSSQRNGRLNKSTLVPHHGGRQVEFGANPKRQKKERRGERYDLMSDA